MSLFGVQYGTDIGADLLRRFNGQISARDLVGVRLTPAGAPDIVRTWMASLPTRVDVRQVAVDAISRVTDDWDLGERAAIALAGTVAAPGLPWPDASAGSGADGDSPAAPMP